MIARASTPESARADGEGFLRELGDEAHEWFAVYAYELKESGSAVKARREAGAAVSHIRELAREQARRAWGAFGDDYY